MYIYIYVCVADKMICQSNAMQKKRGVPYGLWGFQYSRRYGTWDIGIGSSPFGSEGFVKKVAKAKQTQLVVQY